MVEGAPSPEQIAAMEEKFVNRDDGTVCGLRCSHLMRTKHATVHEAEKLDSTAGWHFQSHRCTGITRCRRMVCMFQGVLCHLVRASLSSPTCGVRWNVTQLGDIFTALDGYLEALRVLIGRVSGMLALTLRSRRPSPRRSLPSGQEHFSARKVALLAGIQYWLEYNPRMP